MKGDGRCTCFSGYKGPNCDQGNTSPVTCTCGSTPVHSFCCLEPEAFCVTELPECAALTCSPNARCMEEALTGQLVCQCKPGYQKSGSQCLCEFTWRSSWKQLLLEAALENVLLLSFTAKNPCLQSVCHVHASCEHTGPNQHRCTCREGYSGDGNICMAVNPCQRQHGGCSPESARCVYDGPGKVRVFWVWNKTGSGSMYTTRSGLCTGTGSRIKIK